MVQNKGLYYTAHPSGLPVVGEHLKIQSTDFDTEQSPPTGGITVKTNYVSFDPYQRGRMRKPETKSYAPPFELNKPITNGAVATVLKSDNSKFKSGDVIKVPNMGTVEYAALPKEIADGSEVLDNKHSLDPKVFIGALGMPGLTAYSSFYEIVSPLVLRTCSVTCG